MAEAEVTKRRRISTIWLVPIVALLLGAWMVFYTLQSQGPAITIVFSDAEGIEEGKTKIKLRNVEIGLVETARLGKDLKSVVVEARLDKVAEPLLREDTQFWVVRPRVGASGVSGIGTLLSGGYIELSPGTKGAERLEFVGLEMPPVTPAGTPGLHVKLLSDKAGSVRTGNPILYKGFQVGRVESDEFDVAIQKMVYTIFIGEPYADLVTSNSRFWNISGVSVRSTPGGIQLEMGSIESLLIGGITFGLPDGARPGGPVQGDTSFTLHASYDDMSNRPFRIGIEYVVSFPQSVRGLAPGAPVEYRGIRVGRVERVLLEEAVREDFGRTNTDIPILLRIEPGAIGLSDDETGKQAMVDAIRGGVAAGLRATLVTGSLLTGAKFIAMDYFPNEEPREMGEFVGRPTIPSIGSGLEGIQVEIAALLEKFNALPLETTLARVDGVLASVEELVGSDSVQGIPVSMEATLEELRTTLASISTDSTLQERVQRTLTELDRTLQGAQGLLDTLGEHPNALIFNSVPGLDPEPPAGSP